MPRRSRLEIQAAVLQACQRQPASVSVICQRVGINLRTWSKVFAELHGQGFIRVATVVVLSFQTRNRVLHNQGCCADHWAELSETDIGWTSGVVDDKFLMEVNR